MAIPVLSERLRQAYLALPLSNAAKQRLINLVYRAAGPAFRGTVHYEAWKRSRAAVHSAPRLAASPPRARLEAETRFEAVQRPTVSVVVWARHGYLAALRCLHRIAACSREQSIETILIDDGCADPEMGRLARIPGLRVETMGRAAGYAQCCNRAAELARGRYLHFLGDQALVHEGWLEALLRVFETHADCALVGPKLLLPDGRLQAAGGVVWRDGSAWHLGHGDDPSRSDYNYLRETDYCPGIAMMVPAALFERLGRLASGAAAGCEDVDLAFKARAGGGRAYFQPASWVHLAGGDAVGEHDGRRQLEAARVIRASWGSVLDALHRPYGTAVRIARERLKPQRTVLVLDQYVPKPDRDAGSRTVWEFITTLRADGWNLKFWPHSLWYEPGYTERLQALGVEVFYGREHSDRFSTLLQELGPSLGAVLINRPLVAREYLPHVRRFSQARVLYYGHDIHHDRLREQARVLGVRPGPEQRLMADLEPRIWKACDVVFYPSDTEVAEVRAHDPAIDARVIPVLAFERFGTPRARKAQGRARLLMVAAFGHAPNRDGVLWLMREVLPILRRRGVAFELKVVGSNVPDELRALLGPDVALLGPVSDQELDTLYQTSDLDLVPLRYGAGVKMKVVEALRWGLPLVTTPAGIQGLAGLERIVPACEDAGQFAERIEHSIANPAEMERMSGQMIEYARGRFSREAMRSVLSDSLRPQRPAAAASPRTAAVLADGVRAGA